MRTDRLLHLGCGLLALSLLCALVLSSVRPSSPDATAFAAASLVDWVRDASLLAGVLLLVAHVVARTLAPAPPSLEEQLRDWYEES